MKVVLLVLVPAGHLACRCRGPSVEVPRPQHRFPVRLWVPAGRRTGILTPSPVFGLVHVGSHGAGLGVDLRTATVIASQGVFGAPVDDVGPAPQVGHHAYFDRLPVPRRAAGVRRGPVR